MNRAARRKGMTLLELIVALTLTGVTVSVGYATLSALVDRDEGLRAVGAESMTAARARATLAEWIGAARVDPMRVGASFRGLDGEREGRPDDRITFLTGARTPLRSSRTLVTLYVGLDSAGRARGLIASLRDWDGQASSEVLLVPGVEGFEVRFLTGLREMDPWLSSWISGSALPVGVELRLHAEVGRRLPPLLEHPILIPLHAGR